MHIPEIAAFKNNLFSYNGILWPSIGRTSGKVGHKQKMLAWQVILVWQLFPAHCTINMPIRVVQTASVFYCSTDWTKPLPDTIGMVGNRNGWV